MDMKRIASASLVAVGVFVFVFSWVETGSDVLSDAAQNLILGLALVVVGSLLFAQYEGTGKKTGKGKK